MDTNKKGFFSLILLLVLFLILGNISADYYSFSSLYSSNVIDDTVKINSVSKQVNELYANEKQVKTVPVTQQQVTNKKLNETYIIGNMEYVVSSAEDRGTKFGFTNTTGKFIVLIITARNVGYAEDNLAEITLQDGLGRKYQMSQWLLEYGIGHDLYGRTKDFSGIPPGISETFYAPFEVSADATKLKLIYVSTSGNSITQVDLGL